MRTFLVSCSVVMALSQSGCATVDPNSPVGKAANLANQALEAVGITQPELPTPPELPDVQMPASKVALKLHAGSNLNSGATGKPLSVVTRIYKLKQTSAFFSAPYDAFLDSEREKQLLGADLIEVREVNLTPGQIYETTEKVAAEAGYLAVVTLYRTPAPQNWRVAFAVKDAQESGILLGLHACSLTLGAGSEGTTGGAAPLSHKPARCQ